MPKMLTVLILSAAILLGTTVAYACHCYELNPPLVEYEWADAVFTGIVMSVAPTADPDYNEALVFVTAYWKGVGLVPVYVYTFSTAGACGIDFQQYVEYIFYAKNGMTCCGLGVALCTRTQGVAGAQEDFDTLGPPVASIPVDNETWGTIKELYE